MVLLDEEESDGEGSTISLSDLPVPEALFGEVTSPPEPSEQFEFLSAGAPSMLASDDVISGGKLLPFISPDPFPSKTGETRKANPIPEPDKWRSSSVGDQPRGCLWDDKAAAAYRKLRGISGTGPDPIRTRPKWYLMALGAVRVPTGMDLSEIRIRQWRRNPVAVASEEEGVEVRGSWKLLRSLSCKSIEVATDRPTRTVHVSQ